MSMSPENFTYENLNSLKFRELQKLSVHFKVSKRWARKEELIKTLLALKDKKMSDKAEELNWVHGNIFFSDVKMNDCDSELNKRLTFNISGKNSENSLDPRLTFNVTQKNEKLLDSNDIKAESRQTYEIPNSIIKEEIAESRATFTINSENLMSEIIDPRATFNVPKNENKLTKLTKLKEKLEPEKVNDVNLNKENLNTNLLKKSLKDKKNEIKVLSISCARETRRKKKDENPVKNDSCIKLSKKSINIKKSSRQPINKLEIVQSPALLSLEKSVKKENVISNLSKTLPRKFSHSKIPSRLQFTEKKTEDQRKPMVECNNVNNKKNINITKTSSLLPPNTCVKRQNTNSLPLQTASNKKETEEKVKKVALEKPKTAAKMPNFTKIHQKQFEQMDSLDDYLKKREERSKRLFGISQPGSQLKNSTSLCQFDPSVEKNREEKNPKKILTPLQRKNNNVTVSQKKCLKTKLPPISIQINIKEKNRSQIYGVRTNKRFELQMRFRNK